MNIFGHQAQIKEKKANFFGWALVNPSRTQIGMLVNQIIFSKIFFFHMVYIYFKKEALLQIKSIPFLILLRYEDGEQEHCLEMWDRDGKGLGWNDTPCSFSTFFICEA